MSLAPQSQSYTRTVRGPTASTLSRGKARRGCSLVLVGRITITKLMLQLARRGIHISLLMASFEDCSPTITNTRFSSCEISDRYPLTLPPASRVIPGGSVSPIFGPDTPDLLPWQSCGKIGSTSANYTSIGLH